MACVKGTQPRVNLRTDFKNKTCTFVQTLDSAIHRINRLQIKRLQIYMYRLANFNMLFQFVLTKFFQSELFSSLQNVDHVIN